tara:strand:+ start:43531 stop:43647 length:117 start_codon:yes stop_codon:yes gene_type:complete
MGFIFYGEWLSVVFAFIYMKEKMVALPDLNRRPTDRVL